MVIEALRFNFAYFQPVEAHIPCGNHRQGFNTLIFIQFFPPVPEFDKNFLNDIFRFLIILNKPFCKTVQLVFERENTYFIFGQRIGVFLVRSQFRRRWFYYSVAWNNFFIFAVMNLIILRKLFTINTFTYV